MTQKIIGQTYAVYDVRAITMSPADALVFLSTQNKQEAIKYANEYNGAVYSYDILEDNELTNETLVHYCTADIAFLDKYFFTNESPH